MSTSIGEFMAALRKAQGRTQMDVANELGVSNKTVSSWETGASCPDIAMLPAIAELYGVTCDELLRGERLHTAPPEAKLQEKREKAIAFQIKKHKNRVYIAALISAVAALLSILLTVLLGLRFGGTIGFLTGMCVLLVPIALTFAVCHNSAFWCSGEEAESPSIEEFRRYLFRIRGRICLLCAAVFGFILINAFLPHTNDLRFMFLFGLPIALGTYLIALAVYLFCKARNELFDAQMRKALRYRLWTALATFGAVAVLIMAAILTCILTSAAGIYNEDWTPWLVAALAALLAVAAAVYTLLQYRYNEKQRKQRSTRQ